MVQYYDMEYKKHKLHLAKSEQLTFEEVCDQYIEYCKYRNLREGTIKHYKQSYLNFYKNIDRNMLIRDFDESVYNNYVISLKNSLHNDGLHWNG